GEVEDVPRRLLDGAADSRGNARDRAPRRVDVEPHSATEEECRIEVSENAGAPRAGRLDPAAAIASRPRLRSRRLWANAHQATLVDPSDGAPAGANRADVDGRD